MSNAIEPQARGPSLGPTLWEARNAFSLYSMPRGAIGSLSGILFMAAVKTVRTPSSVVFSGISF